MRSVILPIIFSLFWAGGAQAAERYKLKDKGGFGSTGRFIELADRYGWASYELEFKFGLELAERRLSEDSSLELTVHMKEGGRWRYRCRASGGRAGRLWANVNLLLDKGVSVMSECQLDPESFAEAVELLPEEVGSPRLVFSVMVKDGVALPARQKGIYIAPAGEMGESPLKEYHSSHGDPSELGVLFASALPREEPPGESQPFRRWVP